MTVMLVVAALTPSLPCCPSRFRRCLLRPEWPFQTLLGGFILADHTGGPGVRLREAPAAKAKRKHSS